jgi:hypothetical protein
MHKAYPLDPNLREIRSVQTIPDILNLAISSAGWTAVQLPAGVACKAVLMQTRDGSAWQMSHLEAGTRYMTVGTSLGIDLAGKDEAILCYAKGTTSTTLEVVFLD